MKDMDNIRAAGIIVDLLESLGFRKDDIYEISDLVKRQADVKEKYEPTTLEMAEPLSPCVN